MPQIQTQHGIAIYDEPYRALVESFNWHSSRTPWKTYVNGRPKRGVLSQTKRISLHRLIMAPMKHQLVDHINGDGLDNRRENLRLCTKSENGRNAKKRVDGQSRFRGVSPHPQNDGRWRATARLNGKQVSLGCYATEEEAAVAYNKFALEHYGAFAKLNATGT